MIDDTDHRVLATLADGDWHSGTDLASVCGISRAALAKRIGKLQNLDHMPAIESRHGKGYRLTDGLDLLQTADGEVHAHLQNIPGLQVLRSCGSTSTELQNNPQVSVVLAEHQTEGRGRRGRQWQAPYAQNILLSLRHRYVAWPENIAALSLVLGMAVVRLLRQKNIPAGIKWPNDIWLDGRKLGGILVDTRGEASSGCELIVGCGLNVHMRGAEGIDQPWSSLTPRGYAQNRSQLSAELIEALQAALRDFGKETLRQLPADFSRWDVFANQTVVLRDDHKQFTGIQRGISAQGALQLEQADGSLREFVVGDLSLRRDSA